MNTQHIAEWLNSEAMRNTAYHNHKKNMAWVATALYLTGAFTLGWHLNNIIDCCGKIFALLVALLITILAVWFVCWQFEQRKIASFRVAGLIQTVIDLYKEGKDNYPTLDWCVQKDYLYPKFISDKIKCDQPQKEDQWISMVISLSAMGIAFVTFAILICC